MLTVFPKHLGHVRNTGVEVGDARMRRPLACCRRLRLANAHSGLALRHTRASRQLLYSIMVNTRQLRRSVRTLRADQDLAPSPTS